MRRLRRIRIGAWLGVLAVALYAWLPGHFAGHVIETALDAVAAIEGAKPDLPSHRHAHQPAGHDERHGDTCPICAAAAASAAPAAAMLPLMAALPGPRSASALATLPESSAALGAAPLTPYAPRGPPSAA